MKQSKIEYLAGITYPLPDDIKICEHNHYCRLRELKELNICFREDYENCKCYKFYNKYGNEYVK